jgi:hypothetical protein
MGLSLSALLFIWGCCLGETGNLAATNNQSMVRVNHNEFSIEYNNSDDKITIIHTSDNDAKIILKKNNNYYKLTTLENETILIIKPKNQQDGIDLNYTAKSVSLDKIDDDTTIITLSSKK